MIYWPREAEDFVTRIPNAAGYVPADGDPALWIEVRNNVGRLSVSGGIARYDVTPLYVEATIGGTDTMPEGEYTYTVKLGSGGRVISQGLLIVGDYKGDREQYETSVNYEQYGQN